MKNKIIVIFSTHLSEEENQNFVHHIDNTIGAPHEVHYYVNHKQYSLTEVYNKAIDEYYSENSIFVMCHNDIVFRTKNWGKILLNKFNYTDFNIIGLAGTTFLPSSGQWWEDSTCMYGIVEHTNGISEWVSQYSEEIPTLKEVVLIDGLFMAFDPDGIIHKFDEEFKGFHFYDISFCVSNYLDGCNIGVTTSIRVIHKSIGMVNEEWNVNRTQFVEKYDEYLPLIIPPKFNDIEIEIENQPLVSIIIPTKNNFKFLKNCVNSLLEITLYQNFEIIIADTGSDIEVIEKYNEILNDNVRLVTYDYYNFAKINNDVVKNHINPESKYLLFCNDDIKLLNDAISYCVSTYEVFPNLGTVGIRLHYANNKIQHNGITIFRNGKDNFHVTHKDLKSINNFSTGVNFESLGNTAAFMLIKQDLFIDLGYFNENYISCYEDVELNLKCKIKGLKNVTISDAVAYHYESISRKKSPDMLKKNTIDYYMLKDFILKNNLNFV